jgi:hypothetical protein
MDKSDTDALRNAVQLLEHPSLAARLANMIGKPVELWVGLCLLVLRKLSL